MSNEASRELARAQWTRLVLFLGFCRMNVVAYSAILRVTVTERLWSAPAPKRYPVGGSLDIVDGQPARAKRMTSLQGAFLDPTVDRICDGLVFSGCVVYYAGTPMMLVSLVVLIASFTSATHDLAGKLSASLDPKARCNAQIG